MTARDRSALLRMAGNIAAGIVSDPAENGGQEGIAHEAVSIALLIFNDERLKVTEEGKP